MRHTMFLILAFSILGGGIRPASAEASIVGAGTQQCGLFLSNLEEAPAIKDFYVSWMQGFLSGWNVGMFATSGETVDIMGWEGQFRWVLNFCEENPLDTFGLATSSLFTEIVERHTSSD